MRASARVGRCTCMCGRVRLHTCMRVWAHVRAREAARVSVGAHVCAGLRTCMHAYHIGLI